jgi:tRNA-dihydrouridine synthase A
MQKGVPLRTMARHWLNLFHGQAGARAWRRNMSDAKLLNDSDARMILKDVPSGIEPAHSEGFV